MPTLSDNPVHLGLGASASILPHFSGTMDWYSDYSAVSPVDGIEGRLVTSHTFETNWGSWEMHPMGAEVVICITGQLILHQEHSNGTIDKVTLNAGDYAINPAGIWHTADVDGPCTAIFITAGTGTQHRPR